MISVGGASKNLSIYRMTYWMISDHGINHYFTKTSFPVMSYHRIDVMCYMHVQYRKQGKWILTDIPNIQSESLNLILGKNYNTFWYKSIISSVEVYDKHIITCQFSYHTFNQPSFKYSPLSLSALGLISWPRAEKG